jgi:hypothetical protein
MGVERRTPSRSRAAVGLEGVVRICSRPSSDAVMTAWLWKPTRGAEQRAIGHGVAVRQRFLALTVALDFETAKHDHHRRRTEPA